MDKSLFDQINAALKARGPWEVRQETFYRMRNGGIRRRSKPYPGAPDLHFPLGDSLIEKLKPSYVQQMYGNETIASFVSLKTQTSDVTSAAAYWFDYNLKQRSNFERTMFVTIDEMLQDGFTPVKVYWDQDCKQLAFDQVDPLHLIVPSATQEFNAGGGTDWMVHIIPMSVGEYRANDKFNQDDDYIKSITGKGDSKESGDANKKQSVDLREGINCSDNENEIIIWEVYNRDRKTKKITVETISPLRPVDDDAGPVRAPFGLPYNKGVFKGGQAFPFFKVRAELKGKGHYSPRGLIEINASFEASLSKSWNTLHEWMDFFSKPQFTSTQPIPNGNNYRTKPGGILPPGLTPVETPSAPSSIREDMEFTRSLSEYRTQLPDLGASQHLTDSRGGGKVTATQINAIVGQSGQGNDMRARVFRLDLGEGLNMAWALLLQYSVADLDEQGQPDPKSLTYVVDNEILTLGQDAIHEDYEIVPNGSADSWNKGAEFQKFMALYQALQGNPYIAPDEATKMLLEKVDPRLVKRLFRDPGDAQQSQLEQQATELVLMEYAKFPAPTHPADDDKTHLQGIKAYIEEKLQANENIAPGFARLILAHGDAHSKALHAKKDPMAAALDQQMTPIVQLLAHIAASDQAGNVIPMQSAGGNGPVPPSNNALASPPTASTSKAPDPIADASKLMSGLSQLMKAGVPITHADVNQVLGMAGLPPLSTTPVMAPQPQQMGAPTL